MDILYLNIILYKFVGINILLIYPVDLFSNIWQRIDPNNAWFIAWLIGGLGLFRPFFFGLMSDGNFLFPKKISKDGFKVI